jgi:hypothetical protein
MANSPLPEEKKTEYITKKKTKRKMGPASGLGKKEPEIRLIVVDEDGKMLDQPMFEKFSKGGRAGYKDGSKGCGKAKTGRGRAYGKNS